MSGLAGIWNVAGEPIGAQVLALMSQRMRHRGPDGEKHLLAGNAGFAYQSLQVTPESQHETQPLQHEAGNVLLWDGRLDNRDEVLSIVADQNLDRKTPDADLVLSLYLARGDDFLARLEGDFALAMFDSRRQQLLLARDIMGPRTLYYCMAEKTVLFASEIKALLAHPKVEARPNDVGLAEWLYQIPDYSDPTRTFFEGIHSVPPGHVVRITPGGIEPRRFWDFDVHATLRLKRHEEYVDAYRDCFMRAVRNRLRTAHPVAITVSGGLDSSSIYCVAKRLQETEPHIPPLQSFVAVSDDRLANESAFQNLIEQQYGPIHKLPLTSAAAFDRSRLERAAWYSEGPYLKWMVWRALSQSAVSGQSRVMLSGFFGDHLLVNPHYLLDLLWHGRLTTVVKDLGKYYDWWEDIPKKEHSLQLYRGLKGYLVPESLRPFYHRLRRRFGGGRTPYLPWFSPRFAAVADQLLASAQPMRAPHCRAHIKAIYHYVHSRLLSIKMDMEMKFDSEFSSDVAFPFRDRALVALLMSMPGEVVYRFGSRGIHREAMAGLIPEPIRLRRSKAGFLAPAREGARLDLLSAAQEIRSGRARSLGYLAEDELLNSSLTVLEKELTSCQEATLPWLAGDLVGLEDWFRAFFPGNKGWDTI